MIAAIYVRESIDEQRSPRGGALDDEAGGALQDLLAVEAAK
jgi:hypothetical protein